jgi:hypothetical protein
VVLFAALAATIVFAMTTSRGGAMSEAEPEEPEQPAPEPEPEPEPEDDGDPGHEDDGEEAG